MGDSEEISRDEVLRGYKGGSQVVVNGGHEPIPYVLVALYNHLLNLLFHFRLIAININ